MSISRKNWSALSSLARQWTMEDEEEVEREKRRRVKSSCSADPDADSESETRKSSRSDDTTGTEASNETSQDISSVEQLQLDFVEMLRVRDEKRRMRHVETLRRQKEEDEGDVKVASGDDGRVVLLGELDEDKDSVFKPQTPLKSGSEGPGSSSRSRADAAKPQNENRVSSSKDPDPDPAPRPARKFVSSVSISLDKSSSTSRSSTSMSPCSPTAPLSPRDHWPSPSQSPSSYGFQSPVQNGDTHETRSDEPSSDGKFEPTTKPAFVKQSSRTASFRMLRKSENTGPQVTRSASMRMVLDKDQNEDENKTSSFQRNSRQRISARFIQEKMEQLAQAAQKSEVPRSPDVTQRTLGLLEEVSRKRSLFEKDQNAQSNSNPGLPRQELRGFTSGLSERINLRLNRTSPTGSVLSPDLRHVDISSRRNLFETRGEEGCIHERKF